MEELFRDTSVDSDSDEFIRTLVDDLDDVTGRKFFEVNGGAAIEVCGPPGSGKTLFCMQLAVNVSMPRDLGGLQGEVIYIETDNKFFPCRLTDVYEGTVAALGGMNWDFPSKFHHCQVTSSKELLEVVSSLDSVLEEDLQNVRLIVIDSLSVLREDLSDFRGFTGLLMDLMEMIGELIEERKVMVVVTSPISRKHLASECHSFQVDRRLILKRVEGDEGFAFVDKFNGPHPLTAKYKITKEGIRSGS